MAAGATYTPLATTTLTSASATVTFSSISSAYTDLVLIYNGKFASANGQIALNFNGDTATNYSDNSLNADGSAVTAARDTTYGRIVQGYTASANVDNMTIINIMNYANTNMSKTVISRHNTAAGANVQLSSGAWRSTAAINSIAVSCYNGINFTAGSTFTLYGILAA